LKQNFTIELNTCCFIRMVFNFARCSTATKCSVHTTDWWHFGWESRLFPACSHQCHMGEPSRCNLYCDKAELFICSKYSYSFSLFRWCLLDEFWGFAAQFHVRFWAWLLWTHE